MLVKAEWFLHCQILLVNDAEDKRCKQHKFEDLISQL